MNLSWLLPDGKGVPVLMYHKVWPGINDALTITPERLREHWTYLKMNGYNTVSLPDFLDIITGRKPCPEKAILITFDDGYRNNLTYAYPLLKELGWKAVFFIITRTLEENPVEKDPAEQKMAPAELAGLDPSVVQLALHGYDHENMRDMSPAGMEGVIASSIKAANGSKVPFHMVFAYPYGAFPRKEPNLPALKEILKDKGISGAFRIGNKVCPVPAPDIYEIKRIDVRGTDTVRELAIKLKKGKLKPF